MILKKGGFSDKLQRSPWIWSGMNDRFGAWDSRFFLPSCLPLFTIEDEYESERVVGQGYERVLVGVVAWGSRSS